MPAPSPIAGSPAAEGLATVITQFWAPVEEAAAQTNSTMARWGLKDRPAIDQTGRPRWISHAGPEEWQRAISVIITLLSTPTTRQERAA